MVCALQQRSPAILQVKFISANQHGQPKFLLKTKQMSAPTYKIKVKLSNQNRWWPREWRGRMWDRLGGWSLMAAPLWYKQEMWSECPSGPQSPVCGDTTTKHERTRVLQFWHHTYCQLAFCCSLSLREVLSELIRYIFRFKVLRVKCLKYS